MKNILIYISPYKKFLDDGWGEVDKLVKIQIDNSLSLGWQREDILLVTNFDYEYNGIKALVIGDENYCDFSPTASKINSIITLFDLGLIKDGIYWFHDLDAFQLTGITESEVEQELGDADMGITDYGLTTMNKLRNLRWSTGTIFFKKGSKDIFDNWREEIYRYQANEEIILLEILKKKRNQSLIERIKRMNITYNLATRKRDIVFCYTQNKDFSKDFHYINESSPIQGENSKGPTKFCSPQPCFFLEKP